MRFIATADWQLGKQAAFLPPEARARYSQARLDAVARVGRVAEEKNADFVVVCGDVFESNQLDRQILSRTFEVLRGYTVPVYLLPGNHDPLDAASIYDSPEFLRGCPRGVQVLRESGVAETISCRDGSTVQLIAAPWFSKTPRTDLTRAAVEQVASSDDGEEGTAPDGGGPLRLVVAHGAVRSLSAAPDALGLVDDAFLMAQISKGAIDFVVLGDRHGTLEVEPSIWYPGTPEVTAEREINPGNVLVVDIDGESRRAEVAVEHVGSWELRALAFALNNDDDVDRLSAELEQVTNKEKTGLKLALTGTLSVREKARLDDVLDRMGDLFARLDVWESHTDLAVLSEDDDFSGLGLGGFTLAAAGDLQAQARNEAGTDATVAADSLGLLYRLAGGTS